MKLTRLPARYAGLAMPFILSIVMTMVVSAVATLKNLGFAEGVAGQWLTAWLMSWIVAFPTLLMALSLTRRLVRRIVEPA